MSSVYDLLCMSHDPALAVTGRGWTTPEEAIAAALEPTMHDWLVEDHGKCDLLVGRYSASLVEICCPASREHGGHNRHNSPQWIDRDWLVLLRAAMAAPADPALRAAIEDVARGQSCWTWQRLDRLASEFGLKASSMDTPLPIRPRCRCATQPAPPVTDPRGTLHTAIERAIAYNERYDLQRPTEFRIHRTDAERFLVTDGWWNDGIWSDPGAYLEAIRVTVDHREGPAAGWLRAIDGDNKWRDTALDVPKEA